jgi:hypothetical protein
VDAAFGKEFFDVAICQPCMLNRGRGRLGHSTDIERAPLLMGRRREPVCGSTGA